MSTDKILRKFILKNQLIPNKIINGNLNVSNNQIQSLKDLVEAQEQPCLFMNKFDLNVDTRPITCLREYFTSKV